MPPMKGGENKMIENFVFGAICAIAVNLIEDITAPFRRNK